MESKGLCKFCGEPGNLLMAYEQNPGKRKKKVFIYICPECEYKYFGMVTTKIAVEPQ